MRTVGLFTLHQRQKEVLDLLRRYGELYVHFRGNVLYKIVPLQENKVAQDKLPNVTKAESDVTEDENLRAKVEAKLHGLPGGNRPE